MTACPPGTYNTLNSQSYCTNCQSGYYCPLSAMAEYFDYICTAGHYCPIGTAIPVQCPIGKFSPHSIIGNGDINSCTNCTAGYYCASEGMMNVTGKCDAGYYCTSNAYTRTQQYTSEIGGPCPVGSYCLQGSGAPKPCPIGSYMPSTLNTGFHFMLGINYLCYPCPSGKSCNQTGLSHANGGINKGYWSIAGAKTATPICSDFSCSELFGLCPIGSYCPGNTVKPLPCSSGYYQDEIGQFNCKVL